MKTRAKNESHQKNNDAHLEADAASNPLLAFFDRVERLPDVVARRRRSYELLQIKNEWSVFHGHDAFHCPRPPLTASKFTVVCSANSSIVRAVPTLVLSHRYSADSNALFSAALASGWDVERLHFFRCPEGLAARRPVFYGETLLADAIAEDLGIALLDQNYCRFFRATSYHLRRSNALRRQTLSSAQ